MQLFRDLEALPASLRRGAVAIGNFDGVHRGHARIAERLIAKARAAGGAAVIFTFDPHPVRILRPDHAPPPLTWTDRKAELLARQGVDAMIAYPTDEALLALEPEVFFERIVRECLDARAMVEGPNFFFGHNRRGDIELLHGLTAAAGIDLEVALPLVVDGDYVSSSRVRKLIESGRVEEAARLSTEPYRIRGMVVHGAGRGAKLGFPTANVDGIDTLLPAMGVYAGRVMAGGELHPAAINIGPNPTFGEQIPKVEVHLLEWREPLYGQVVEVDILARLRDIQRFDGAEALQQQLARDIDAVRQTVAAWPPK